MKLVNTEKKIHITIIENSRLLLITDGKILILSAINNIKEEIDSTRVDRYMAILGALIFLYKPLM